MKTRNTLVLSGLAILVMLVALNTSVVAIPVGSGDTIPGPLAVYTIKKAALVCDWGASAPPYQSPPEVGGCVDVFAQRPNQYLFTGEQLAWLVVARDLGTSLALPSTAQLMIDGTKKMECVAIGYHQAECLAHQDGSCSWYGHDVSDLLASVPYKMGISDPVGFDADWDVLYQCTLTVTSDMVGSPSSMVVSVSDLQGQTAVSVPEKWYFNPIISASIAFQPSGTSILFPPAQQGQIVQSSNAMEIKNTAAGGVALAVFFTGNDLKDTSGIGMCYDSHGFNTLTNVLDINNMAYRCEVGTVLSEQFTCIPHLKQSTGCQFDTFGWGRICYAEDFWMYPNDLIPDKMFPTFLYNGDKAECVFQLSVPLPCLGTYSAANAVDVLLRAI